MMYSKHKVVVQAKIAEVKTLTFTFVVHYEGNFFSECAHP